MPRKTCRWCGQPLARREGERPSSFAKRLHCDRACQVSYQNSDRARQRHGGSGRWAGMQLVETLEGR